jgi:peroxiredoxin
MVKTKERLMAPDFFAQDSEGRTVKLSDFRGKKNVVLVFNRGFF